MKKRRRRRRYEEKRREYGENRGSNFVNKYVLL